MSLSGNPTHHQSAISPFRGSPVTFEMPPARSRSSIRSIYSVAKRYVAGKVHFGYLVGPAEACAFWARVHGAHSAIEELAREWLLLIDRVWNEQGQHAQALPEAELRRQIAQDLGEV